MSVVSMHTVKLGTMVQRHQPIKQEIPLESPGKCWRGNSQPLLAGRGPLPARGGPGGGEVWEACPFFSPGEAPHSPALALLSLDCHSWKPGGSVAPPPRPVGG